MKKDNLMEMGIKYALSRYTLPFENRILFRLYKMKTKGMVRFIDIYNLFVLYYTLCSTPKTQKNRNTLIIK